MTKNIIMLDKLALEQVKAKAKVKGVILKTAQQVIDYLIAKELEK